MRHLLVLLASAGLVAGCQSATAPAPTTAAAAAVPAPGAPRTPPRIDGTEAKKLVASGALLLDVRTPEEFADGHLDGARNLPVGELEGALSTLPKDKPIVVYCAAGPRATAASAMLARAGYDAHNLGAMANWSR